MNLDTINTILIGIMIISASIGIPLFFLSNGITVESRFKRKNKK